MSRIAAVHLFADFLLSIVLKPISLSRNIIKKDDRGPSFLSTVVNILSTDTYIVLQYELQDYKDQGRTISGE